MAITKIDFPSSGTPVTNTEYTAQNNILTALLAGFDGLLLTEWDNKTTEPKIKQSVIIRHAGNIFEVDSGDETISGTLSAGYNYVKLTGTGSTLTASWITSLTGYTYNPVYNGWYNGTDQVLTEFVYLDGSDNINTKLINRYDFTNGIDQDGKLFRNITINNNLTVNNDLTTNGNATLGNATSDTATVTGIGYYNHSSNFLNTFTINTDGDSSSRIDVQCVKFTTSDTEDDVYSWFNSKYSSTSITSSTIGYYGGVSAIFLGYTPATSRVVFYKPDSTILLQCDSGDTTNLANDLVFMYIRG